MLVWVIVIAVGGLAAVSLVLYFMQSRMVFYPTRELAVTPDQAGLDYEDIWIEVDSDQRVHGWYFTPPGDPVDSFPVVLFCHGNAGNISHRLETVDYLLAQGAGVLLFDYRGYGRSDGSAGESRAYEDAAACHDWLVHSRGIDPGRIVIFGRSLGGAIAVDAASKRPCRGLIVESSFSSVKDMARKMFPFLPVQWLLKYRFDSESKIGSVNCPVLVTHSPADEVVPYELGRKLFRAAESPKMFVDLSGGHNEREYFDDPGYRQAVSDILSGRASGW